MQGVVNFVSLINLVRYCGPYNGKPRISNIQKSCDDDILFSNVCLVRVPSFPNLVIRHSTKRHAVGILTERIIESMRCKKLADMLKKKASTVIDLQSIPVTGMLNLCLGEGGGGGQNNKNQPFAPAGIY